MVQCSTALDQQLQTSDRLQLQSAAGDGGTTRSSEVDDLKRIAFLQCLLDAERVVFVIAKFLATSRQEAAAGLHKVT